MGFDMIQTNRGGCAPFAPATAFDRLLGSFFAPGFSGSGVTRLSPSVNVLETAHDYVLTFEVPGLSHEDVTITVEGDSLTVRGQKQRVELSEGESLHLAERRFGSFERSFTFPHSLAENAVEARVADGVLTVNVKKSEEARSRRIKVKKA